MTIAPVIAPTVSYCHCVNVREADILAEGLPLAGNGNRNGEAVRGNLSVSIFYAITKQRPRRS